MARQRERETHMCLRVYVHPENDIVDLMAVAQWMSYTRFSLPETQSKGIGWALKPGDFDRSPCPGERERESPFGSSAAPLLGSLCCSLASGGSWGVNLDCTSRGAFPVLSAVLVSHI